MPLGKESHAVNPLPIHLKDPESAIFDFHLVADAGDAPQLPEQVSTYSSVVEVLGDTETPALVDLRNRHAPVDADLKIANLKARG